MLKEEMLQQIPLKFFRAMIKGDGLLEVISGREETDVGDSQKTYFRVVNIVLGSVHLVETYALSGFSDSCREWTEGRLKSPTVSAPGRVEDDDEFVFCLSLEEHMVEVSAVDVLQFVGAVVLVNLNKLIAQVRLQLVLEVFIEDLLLEEDRQALV